MIRLFSAEIGKTYRIEKIESKKEIRRRLHELGVREGGTISVKSRAFGGGVEAECFSRSIGIRAEIAEKILLAPCKKADENGVPLFLSQAEAVFPEKVRTAALVGTPNAGKSTVFNALTGKNVRVGNYTGVTVGITGAKTRVGEGEITLYDLPGVYSLDGFSKEEEIALSFLRETPPDVILCVTECALFERNAAFLSAVLCLRRPTVFLFTMADEFYKRGGVLKEDALSRKLGAPVFCLNAKKAGEIKALRAFLGEVFFKSEPTENAERRPVLGKTIKEKKESVLTAGGKKAENERRPAISETGSEPSFYRAPKRGESRLDALLRKPIFSLCFFLLLLGATFYLTFGKYGAGTFLKNLAEGVLQAFTAKVKAFLSPRVSPFLCGLFTDGILPGICGVLSFFPQLAVLFSCTEFMEESGLLPRLAFRLDGVFQKVGLSGRAVFSALLGYGCTAIALLSLRGIAKERERKKTALLLPFLSCSAKVPVYLLLCGAFFGGSVLFIGALYLFSALLAAWTLAAADRRYPEKEGIFLLEFPPYRLPSPKNFVKDLRNYFRSFIIKIGTTVFCTVTALYFLENLTPRFTIAAGVEESLLYYFARAFSFPFYPMGITDWRFAAAAACGIAAKEAVAGSLTLLFPAGLSGTLSAASALSYLVFLALYPPCTAAISAMRREFGFRFTARAVLFQTGLAFAVSYAVYFAARLFFVAGWWAFAAATAAVAVILLWMVKKREKNHRGKRNHAESTF